MDEKQFILDFIEQLEGHDGSEITMNTVFRDLECWDSLTGAAVQIMINDNYNALIPNDYFRNSETVGDLFELAKKYKNKNA